MSEGSGATATRGGPEKLARRKAAEEGRAKGGAAAEAGKGNLPKLLQIHVSWAPTDEEAIANAVKEWPNGGMPFPKQDIKNPEDFAAMMWRWAATSPFSPTTRLPSMPSSPSGPST